jgi:hypothetical protein
MASLNVCGEIKGSAGVSIVTSEGNAETSASENVVALTGGNVAGSTNRVLVSFGAVGSILWTEGEIKRDTKMEGRILGAVDEAEGSETKGIEEFWASKGEASGMKSGL